MYAKASQQQAPQQQAEEKPEERILAPAAKERRRGDADVTEVKDSQRRNAKNLIGKALLLILGRGALSHIPLGINPGVGT